MKIRKKYINAVLPIVMSILSPLVVFVVFFCIFICFQEITYAGGNMFEKRKKSEQRLSDVTVPAGREEDITQVISENLSENMRGLREIFGNSFDLVIKETQANGVDIAFVALDGMYNGVHASQAIIEPIQKMRFFSFEPETVYGHLCRFCAAECDAKENDTMKSAVDSVLNGCMLLFVDGVKKCMAFSVQGYPRRPVQPPESETQENGSREGFVDMFKDNVTLVRRRIKSPFVRFENFVVGETSNTSVVVCYHSQRADPEIVKNVKKKIENIRIDIVPGAGALKPFLEEKRLSFFSCAGTTERPDVFAAKISEGRIGIIVDGTPYAIIVPYLFIENFHSLDDYLNRPYYTAATRILKIICFFLAVFLPGTYVAVGTFHQEIFPSEVIADVVASLQNTPFPLVVESLLIHFIYEIVREAGLRMPKSVGHTVSIVGALVIGDAAVSAGLISAPMLIIVAITAICSAVLPSLHEPSAVLRFLFIILGGIMGLYGVMLGFALLLADICSMNSFGIPFTAPVSPFDSFGARDSIFFAGWRKAGKRFIRIQNLKGAKENGKNS